MIKIELHITCNALTSNQIETFENFCYSIDSKPIVILLSSGENKQQPMISKIISCKDKNDIKKELDFIKSKFKANGYRITRIKMEVAPWDIMEAEQMFNRKKENYFEWHGKINIENEKNATLAISEFGGHISRNVLKKNPNFKLVTIRDYGTEQDIKEKIIKLKKGLDQIGINFIKEELEYCIFDSNVSLDKGWI